METTAPTTPNATKALYIIANAGFGDEIIGIARQAGIRGATIFGARGEGTHHASFLGISVDTEKEVIVCITDAESAERAMQAVSEQAGIKTSAHGVCFAMPVDKAVGISLADPEKQEN